MSTGAHAHPCYASPIPFFLLTLPLPRLWSWPALAAAHRGQGRALPSTCGRERPPAGPAHRTPGGSEGCTPTGVVAQ
jgi:hypothetical protein